MTASHTSSRTRTLPSEPTIPVPMTLLEQLAERMGLACDCAAHHEAYRILLDAAAARPADPCPPGSHIAYGATGEAYCEPDTAARPAEPEQHD